MAHAQTPLSGTISTDTRLTAAASPYLLSGNVLVSNGARLTIEAGVTVYMASGAGLEVRAGSLQALGSASLPVRVLSDKVRTGQAAAAGDWNQWMFQAGANPVRLEYVEFEHGKGLAFAGTSGQLNFVRIRQQSGAAITVDLASSLSGVGNSATDNTLNGIAVPAGDIAGSVRWELRGIAYVVSSGVVSVGASPTITGLQPASVEVGSTTEVTLSGSRLAGFLSASFANPKLTAQLLPGASDSVIRLAVTAAADAAVGATELQLLVDAGELPLPALLIVKAKSPKLTRITPTQVFAGRGATLLQVEGQDLRPDTVVEVNGQALPTTIVSATQATATLPNQEAAATLAVKLRTPDPAQPGNFLLTDSLSLGVVLPQALLSPATVSMFQGNTQVMTLTLPFPAGAGGLKFDLSSSTPLVAGVQDTVVVAEGASTAQFDIRGAGIGAATVTASRAGWQPRQVPVTVVDPPRRIDLTPIVSSLVGLQIGPGITAPAETSLFPARAVGLVVGASATSVLPRAAVVGTTLTLTIKGTGLDRVSAVRAIPGDGLTFATPSGGNNGRELTVQLTVAADAPKTARRIVLALPAGEVLFFNPTESQLLVTSPVPQIESITPQVLVAGAAATKLTVRGTNFRDITGVRFEPAQGLEVQGSPSFNAEGTVLEVTVQAQADAAPGVRVMVLQAAAGDSSALASAANTVQVARSAGTRYQYIMSAQVGLQNGLPVPAADTFAAAGARPVGLNVGAGVLGMQPQAATRGESLTLTVRGGALQAVTGVSFTPSTGITVSAPSVSSDGRELTVRVDIDFNAPDTVREVKLNTASGPLVFARPGDNLFQVQLIQGTRFESLPSPLVGVQVGTAVATNPAINSLHPARAVGLVVGAVATQLTPDAAVVGTQFTLVVRGYGLGAVTQVAALSSDGLTFGAPTASADGRSLSVSVTVAADAAKTQRRIVLRTASGEVSFFNGLESQLLVTSPVPNIDSISPQVVLAGAAVQRLTLRGRNFRDIEGVRFEPATGLSAVGAATVNTEGTLLQVDVQAAADAASGPRVLVLQSAAGESSTAASASNTVQVARTLGTLYQDISSPLVGLQMGSSPSQQPVPGAAQALPAGVIVGPALVGKLPAGSVKGVSGQWVFSGANLQSLSAVRLVGNDGAVVATPASGVTIGNPVISNGGRSATVSYTVAATATSRTYRLEVLAGTQVLFYLDPSQAQWEVLDEPIIDSVSPVVLRQGRSYAFQVRGQNLRRVSEVLFEPGAGLQVASTVQWSADTFGELLTLQLLVSADAPVEPRVVRLRTPAGLTTATPSAANVVSVTP